MVDAYDLRGEESQDMVNSLNDRVETTHPHHPHYHPYHSIIQYDSMIVIPTLPLALSLSLYLLVVDQTLRSRSETSNDCQRNLTRFHCNQHAN